MKNTEILKYEINPREIDRYPVNWEKVFGRAAPLAVEVGCGNGEFLVNWARSCPDWNFLGIELSLASGERIQSRIYSQHLENIRTLRDDARFVLPELFADQSITQLVMNFPDPWPKAKHHKRRLIQPALVARLCEHLKAGGYIHAATDWEDYAIQILQVLSNEPRLTNTASDYAPRPEYRPLTKFEQRGLKLGHGVWDLIFSKK